MKAMQETRGISESRLEAAQGRLMDRGVIANVQEDKGPPTKRKTYIQIINPDTAGEIMNFKLF